MTVYCSYCSTGYLLPDHLMGPRGARVRCPNCGKTFVVLREAPPGEEGAPEVEPLGVGRTEDAAPGAPMSGAPAPGAHAETSPVEAETLPAEEPAPHPGDIQPGSRYEPPAFGAWSAATVAADATEVGLARELLDALAARAGARLTEARGRNRVLAEFGPDLMAVVDEFRRRASGPAALFAFKQVLRERWGVDLITGVEG